MGSDAPSYICELCNKFFSQKSSRNRHVREQHIQSGLYPCKQCGQRFSKKYNLQVHIEHVHSRSLNKVKCSFCKGFFTNLATLKRHINVQHKSCVTNDSSSTALVLKETDAETLAESVLKELKQLQKEIQPLGEIDTTNTNKDQELVDINKETVKIITIKDNLYPLGHFTLIKAQTVKRVDGVKYFICEFCGKEFNKTYNYLRHRRIHTKVRPFICILCKKCFPTTAQLKAHCSTHKLHEKFGLFYNLYNCPKCNEGFCAVRELDNHLCSSSCSNVLFKCPQCLKSYKTLKTLLRHKHLEKDKELEMLKKILPTSFGVKTKLSKDKETYLECNFCGMQVNGEIVLKQHKKRHENLFQNHCTKCQCSFVTQTALKIHAKAHLSSRNFKCQYCNKCFKTDQNCRRHMLNHLKLLLNTNPSLQDTNETLAVYPTCIENEKNDQTETTATCIIKSIKKCKTQRKEKSFALNQLKFKCSRCEKSFRYKAWLKKHFKYSHTDDFAFECNICMRKFRTKQCLQSHLLVHSTERVKHICQVCGRQYASSKSLKLHLRIHTQEKPFNCDKCSKLFRTSGHLIQHRKSKHKE